MLEGKLDKPAVLLKSPALSLELTALEMTLDMKLCLEHLELLLLCFEPRLGKYPVPYTALDKNHVRTHER